ncbi:MAG: chemotaxis protein CheW [Spirochaetales bacterium]|nr:chemotaxis protein CheW [Spirochaetales bacterium]
MESEQLDTKYLIFSIGPEFYGIKIAAVREIIRFSNITPVHDSLEYIMGVINLRGKIIPVMDMRLKFGLDFKEYTDRTVLLILEIHGKEGLFQTALSVDAVHEVVTPLEEDLRRTPEIGLNLKRNYIRGILKAGDRMVMILDINKIVTVEEIVHLRESEKE